MKFLAACRIVIEFLGDDTKESFDVETWYELKCNSMPPQRAYIPKVISLIPVSLTKYGSLDKTCIV